MKRTLVTVVLVSLVAAACGGTTGDTTTTTEAAEETTTTQGEESTSSSGPSTTTTSAPQATGGDADCLEGDWVLDNDAFIDQVFADFGDEAGVGEVNPAGGTLGVSLDGGGTMGISRDDWGFVIESEGGIFKILITGDQTGTWSADGDELSISLDEGPPPEVTTSLVVDGQEVPLPQSPVDVPSEAFSANSTFSCNGDTFSVTTDEFTSTFKRP